MFLFPLFRRRDPWWEADGPAARRERRRRQVVSSAAFLTAFTAAVGAAVEWSIYLGIATALGFHVTGPFG